MVALSYLSILQAGVEESGIECYYLLTSVISEKVFLKLVACWNRNEGHWVCKILVCARMKFVSKKGHSRDREHSAHYQQKQRRIEHGFERCNKSLDDFPKSITSQKKPYRSHNLHETDHFCGTRADKGSCSCRFS